ncbi:bacillithiol system redox-active protein YtxJ [Fredinandcohnia quinoae]|uniref:Bacillithiol system redox-active protein YtxJ n=1 Tax=Fredinandcohnia quinoae TaxID=2918902 RepID=A0AAW5E629_9BACI|nr:bacillithiol system redox-active protein YtxJ [Fredinandcohnia sp. SECRCQ15]MCH1625342.1 bacillithiol system redox-active protein YtxJ [Fredinandcohnia sp. SECRCQ15]
MKKIDSVEEFTDILKTKQKFLLIKHSTTCPISKAAFNEYEAFVSENKGIPTFYLFVQDARPLSNYIAETFNIRHESPQALLFDQGIVTWNVSHWKITRKSLNEATS